MDNVTTLVPEKNYLLLTKVAVIPMGNGLNEALIPARKLTKVLGAISVRMTSNIVWPGTCGRL